MTSGDTDEDSETIRLVWLGCTEENGLAEAFGVPGFRGYLPFMLDDHDSSTGLNEKHLLLGIIRGLPLLRKNKAKMVPNDREQNEILSILMDRLMRGFGWNSKDEMTRDIAPYILCHFDTEITADALFFLMEGAKDQNPYVTLCVLKWDVWLYYGDEDDLNELYIILNDIVIEGFTGLSQEWLRLTGYALYRFKGEPVDAHEWLSKVPEEKDFPNPELAEKFRRLALLPIITLSDLTLLGTAPREIPDLLEPILNQLGLLDVNFPDFDSARVTTDLSPQRHLLSYTYHPDSPTPNEAFGVDVKEMTKFLNDMVNMAVTFQLQNPGGIFLQVDAARRLLQHRKDGGGILMSFAWKKIHEVIGESISKAQDGTLFDKAPDEKTAE